VGVGEAAPQGRLHINGSGDGVTNIITERENASGASENFANVVTGLAGSGFYFREDRLFGMSPAGNVDFIGIDVPNSLLFAGPQHPTTTIRGNLGLGTLSPTAKFEVVGDIKASGMITPSDSRLKTILKSDVKSMGLDAVMNLNVVEYEYNGEGGTKANERHIGLVAQELQRVAPQLVQEFTHTTFEINPKNLDITPVKEEQFLEIRDSEIKYLLLNAIQDQQQIIADQESRIADLEDALVEIRDLMATNSTSTPISVTPSTTNVATLSQNEPNPFSDRTSISYSIPEGSSDASIRIFSVTGQLIETVQINQVGTGKIQLNQVGTGKIQLDNANLSNGTYTYQLVVDGRIVDTNKMISQR